MIHFSQQEIDHSTSAETTSNTIQNVKLFGTNLSSFFTLPMFLRWSNLLKYWSSLPENFSETFLFLFKKRFQVWLATADGRPLPSWTSSFLSPHAPYFLITSRYFTLRSWYWQLSETYYEPAWTCAKESLLSLMFIIGTHHLQYQILKKWWKIK